MSAPTTTSLTIATLPRLTPASLRALLASPTTAPTVAVVDVRDADHIGGHIRGSIHAPSSSLSTALPELVRTLAPKTTVVFHCMLSQQRGPSAALAYARERARLLKGVEGRGGCVEAGRTEGREEEWGEGVQRVAVLTGGFQAWVEAGYGDDEGLTEGFARDIYESLD